MTIRKAEEKDIIAMAELQKKCFSIPLSEKDFSEYLDNVDYILIVADDANKAVGHCLACIAGDNTEIISVAVQNESRHNGFGKALINHIINESKKRNKISVLLEVRQSNIVAQALYEKCGFKTIAVRKHFYELPTENGNTMIFEI